MQKTLQTVAVRPTRYLETLSPKKRQLIVEIISGLFILLFVYTGYNKLTSVKALQEVLPQYPLIGPVSEIVTWSLPITELIVSLLLFFPRTRLLGLYCSFALMSLFTIYLTYMLAFTNAQPCTCGGMLQKMSWPQHMIFNVVFIFFSLIGIRLLRRYRS